MGTGRGSGPHGTQVSGSPAAPQPAPQRTQVTGTPQLPPPPPPMDPGSRHPDLPTHQVIQVSQFPAPPGDPGCSPIPNPPCTRQTPGSPRWQTRPGCSTRRSTRREATRYVVLWAPKWDLRYPGPTASLEAQAAGPPLVETQLPPLPPMGPSYPGPTYPWESPQDPTPRPRVPDLSRS